MWTLYNMGPSIFLTHLPVSKHLGPMQHSTSDGIKWNHTFSLPHNKSQFCILTNGRKTPERCPLEGPETCTHAWVTGQCLQPLVHGWGGSVVQLLYIESSGFWVSPGHPLPWCFWQTSQTSLAQEKNEIIWEHCVHMDRDVSKGIIRCKCILFKVLKNN